MRSTGVWWEEADKRGISKGHRFVLLFFFSAFVFCCFFIFILSLIETKGSWKKKKRRERKRRWKKKDGERKEKKARQKDEEEWKEFLKSWRSWKIIKKYKQRAMEGWRNYSDIKDGGTQERKS